MTASRVSAGQARGGEIAPHGPGWNCAYKYKIFASMGQANPKSSHPNTPNKNTLGSDDTSLTSPMRALALAAKLLRRAAAAPSPEAAIHRAGASHLKSLTTVYCGGYSTVVAPANEVLIPPELLSSKTVWTPDRQLGQYEDLVARVTNFHNDDKGYMIL